MFEARLKVHVGITISDELRAFICEDFERGGHQEMVVQDVQEAISGKGRDDLRPAMDMIRNEFGNLWLRREWWV